MIARRSTSRITRSAVHHTQSRSHFSRWHRVQCLTTVPEQGPCHMAILEIANSVSHPCKKSYEIDIPCDQTANPIKYCQIDSEPNRHSRPTAKMAGIVWISRARSHAWATDFSVVSCHSGYGRLCVGQNE